MFGFGAWEMGIIAVVLLVVMGPTVMPRLGRRLAETFIGVRSAAKELADTVHEADDAKNADGSVDANESGPETKNTPASDG